MTYKATNLIQTMDAALEFAQADYLLQKDAKYEYEVKKSVILLPKATNAHLALVPKITIN